LHFFKESKEMAEPNGKEPEKTSWIVQAREQFEAQPQLFDDPDIPKIDKTKPPYKCSGERLFQRHPKRYADVVKAMATPGCSQRWTCETFQISPHTYRSIKEREQISIATQKKIVLSNLLHGAQLASERAIELLPAASCKDALIGVGILVDKVQLLSGDVTARIEVEHTGPKLSNLEQFEQIIQGLEKKVEGRVIEPSEGAPETELAAENRFPKESANGAGEISSTDLPALQTSGMSLPAGADPDAINAEFQVAADELQQHPPDPEQELDLFSLAQEGRMA
jgi:hypothetical protein